MFRIKCSSLLFLLTMIVAICPAQQKKSASPWSFQSIANIGLLDGQSGNALQLQTVNGAQYKSWFAGIGLGVDYYRFRTIPLFLDIRKEFGRSSSKVFVYADGGISFSWVTDNEKLRYTDEHFGNGFYSDIGFGYKTSIGKNNALLISLGYSYKKLTETYTSYIYYPDDPSGSPKEQIHYSLNRLSIKMGWEF